LQDTYAVLPQSGEAQLRVFNGFNCSGVVNIPGIAVDNNEIESLDFWKAPTLQVDGEETLLVNIDMPCNGIKVTGSVNVTEMQVTCKKCMMRT
jgi:hypothetical protein